MLLVTLSFVQLALYGYLVTFNAVQLAVCALPSNIFVLAACIPQAARLTCNVQHADCVLLRRSLTMLHALCMLRGTTLGEQRRM